MNTVIDVPGYKPGWMQFPEYKLGMFASPKTGFTGLITLFPQRLTGAAVPLDYHIISSVREPYERFVSMFNMTVLHGYTRTQHERLKNGFDQQWIHTWFPDPERLLKNPVKFAKQWLKHAAPELERWGGDHHVISQSRSLRGLLGKSWQEDTRLQLIEMSQWQSTIESRLGVKNYCVENQGIYSISTDIFEELRDLVYKTWPDDLELWNAAQHK
jgi:hypothetical protein